MDAARCRRLGSRHGEPRPCRLRRRLLVVHSALRGGVGARGRDFRLGARCRLHLGFSKTTLANILNRFAGPGKGAGFMDVLTATKDFEMWVGRHPGGKESTLGQTQVDGGESAYPLPYTNDLMRLGVSAILDASEGEIKVGLRNVAEVILDGYRSGLSEGGKPFVLEEKHKWLRKIALDCLDIPAEFWKKMDALPANRKDGPGDARKANRPPAAGTAIEIPSRSSHSGHRQSRPLPVRGCGQLVRRPDRLGSESSNTVRMCLGPAWETLAHLLSGDAGAGDPLSRSVCALMRQMAGSPAWRPIPRRSKLKR